MAEYWPWLKPEKLSDVVDRETDDENRCVWWFVRTSYGATSGYVGSRAEAFDIAREWFPELRDDEDE